VPPTRWVPPSIVARNENAHAPSRVPYDVIARIACAVPSHPATNQAGPDEGVSLTRRPDQAVTGGPMATPAATRWRPGGDLVSRLVLIHLPD
jgi:hypothetical protein